MTGETDFCREAAKWFGLGELLAEPQRVTGGYVHRMYRLETGSGAYALKLLNPTIMGRPDAMGNFRRAEALERILIRNDISVISALEKNGQKMQCLKGQYFYLFPWSEGKALKWHEIREEHCRIAGRLLAGIHRIPWTDVKMSSESEGCHLDGQENIGQIEQAETDWDSCLERAARECPEIAEALRESRELLNLAGREYHAALKRVPQISCICDGDMDCKNVLWIDDKPYIIDLECLDFGNPLTEMFQLALSWAGGTVCELDLGRFLAFLEAYEAERGRLTEQEMACGEWPVQGGIEWETLSGLGYGWLNWLAYNVRRALGEECGDKEEQEMGIRETMESIRRIRYYHTVRADLVRAVKAWETSLERPAFTGSKV